LNYNGYQTIEVKCKICR